LCKVHKIIVDTDPGIDDAMALAFLHHHPEAEMVALTTVFGNADVETTTTNALYLAQRLGLNTPVYKGAGEPLVIARGAAPSHVHGHDALGDTGVTDGFRAAPEATPAHTRMVELIRAHPHEISLLAIGPLTNLALALQADPGIAGLVREVVVMGGAFGWGKKRGNITPYAEANIYNDPHAAAAVFAANWPVRIVGLDVTLECVLTATDALAMSRENETGQFLWDISRGYEMIYRKQEGLQGCCLHDAAAAICLLRPDMFGYVSGPVSVVTEGTATGHTTLEGNTPSQQICRSVDAAAVVALYTQTLSPPHLAAKTRAKRN
jgi:purine nucleosidase